MYTRNTTTRIVEINKKCEKKKHDYYITPCKQLWVEMII